jgi:uncharacterized protein
MDDHSKLYDFLKSRKNAVPPGSAPVSVDNPAPPTRGASPSAGRTLEGFAPIGRYTWRRVIREPSPLKGFGPGPLHSARAHSRDLLFFDTETTGLSGGAGNLAFLLGAGRIDDTDLVIEQYFLSDFPGEAEFLSLIAPLFSREKTFVSYNGSAFDSHLLVSRFRLNRLELEFGRQYDLLHPARRLWKASVGSALGSCSLKNIERAVLGVDRGIDIDGAEVPEFYFRFLRTGDPAALEPVCRHNHIDVRSLVLLLDRIETFIRDPAAALAAATEAFPADGPALGALLLSVDPIRGEDFLETRFRSGDPACGRALGRLYKRKREHARAAAVWESLFNTAVEYEAGVELAMHLEHRSRDARRARSVVDALLANGQDLDSRDRRALEARRTRLERKLRDRNTTNLADNSSSGAPCGR